MLDTRAPSGARAHRKRKTRSHQPIAASGLAQRRAHALAEFPPPVARRAHVQRGVPVALDETTNFAVVPFEGRLPPPLAQCEVVAARPISDRSAPAQHQFAGPRRARPLYRSHGPRAGDDARASDRPILVSGVRRARFRLKGGSGATRSSFRFAKATSRRSRRSSMARCRTGGASSGCISNGSGARLASPASISSSPGRTSTITAIICTTSFR